MVRRAEMDRFLALGMTGDPLWWSILVLQNLA
jgi:hypothetical protein